MKRLIQVLGIVSVVVLAIVQVVWLGVLSPLIVGVIVALVLMCGIGTLIESNHWRSG